jgi:hypothetical protein
MPKLELALLRRGVDHRAAELETCAHCHRHPLIGERVYVYDDDPGRPTLCELCKALRPERPTSSHLVHTPEFGHTMKIIDQRATTPEA